MEFVPSRLVALHLNTNATAIIHMLMCASSAFFFCRVCLTSWFSVSLNHIYADAVLYKPALLVNGTCCTHTRRCRRGFP